MKKVVRLNESELENIISEVLNENYFMNPYSFNYGSTKNFRSFDQYPPQAKNNDTLKKMEQLYNMANSYGFTEIADFISKQMRKFSKRQSRAM